MNNILIVDDDPRFILWLGRALLAANQQPLPACTVDDALVLTSEASQPVDLVIINSSLPRWSELIEMLRCSHSRLKVIGLEAKNRLTKRRARTLRVDAWRQKPARPDVSAEREWVEAVEDAIASPAR